MATIDLPVIGPVDRKWVWIGGGTIAAFVAWSYYNNRSSDAPVIEEGVDGSDVGLGDDGFGNRRGRTGDGTTDQDNDVIDTVAEWTADVVEKLAATDWDTGYVYSTIGKWIAGEGLTTGEKTLVLAAIAASGQPPGGPYPIKTAQPTPTPTKPPKPPAPKPPAPKPATYTTVIVKRYTDRNPPWESTLWGIARHFGKSETSIWHDPKNATLRARTGDNPRRIRTGDRIYVKN
jgi:hypothetical protein